MPGGAAEYSWPQIPCVRKKKKMKGSRKRKEERMEEVMEEEEDPGIGNCDRAQRAGQQTGQTRGKNSRPAVCSLVPMPIDFHLTLK